MGTQKDRLNETVNEAVLFSSQKHTLLLMDKTLIAIFTLLGYNGTCQIVRSGFCAKHEHVFPYGFSGISGCYRLLHSTRLRDMSNEVFTNTSEHALSMLDG